MQSGILEQLRPTVHRVIAPNPGVMTGPGTNSYLLGRRRITLLDPGPPMVEHVEALEAALRQIGGELTQIVVTHTHPDHSPAAAMLAERYDVPLLGRAIADDGHQDTSFSPHIELQHEHDIDVDGERLIAVHTPGHVDNHFCFLHEPSGLLFTGDHIMEGSTVVIIPPAGDMADYIASLERMLEYPLQALAPGHGRLIDEPRAEIEALIKHRLGREHKVRQTLESQQRPQALDGLVVHAYDDVDPALHPIAQLSLWAHLLKLQKDGEAIERDGLWQRV